MFEEKKKKLVIVCSKNTEKYATYLYQMISTNDDQGDTVVGVKDGSIAAVVWNEDMYLANKPQISTADYVLFIGKTKKLADEDFGMIEKSNQYGMKYSCMGKRGMLLVEKLVKRDEYNDFLAYAGNYISDIKKKMDTKKEAVAKDALAVGAGVAAEAASVGAGVAAASGVAVLLPFSLAVFAPVGVVAGGVIGGTKLVRYLKEKNKVTEQQYTCLILQFYLENSREFFNQ